ncbi:MAG: PAS domain-containing protein [Methylocystis sp.]
MLATSVDCVKLIDIEGCVRFVNDAGLALLEADSFAALLGKLWVEFWPEEARPLVREALNEARRGGVARFTAIRPTMKGILRWWEVVVAPMPDQAGRSGLLMATSRDVSKQKARAEAIDATAFKFRALANSIAQLAWMADASGYIFWYNKRWFDYTGSTLEEAEGWGWRASHHPEHVERVVNKISECFRTGEEWEDTFPLRGVDGAYRWFLSRAHPVRDDQGRITVWCGTNTDITDELNYRQRLEKKARLIDLSHEAILVRDMDDKIERWNTGCVELFGYTREEAIGAKCDELLRSEFPTNKSEVEASLRETGFWSGELRHLAKDGSPVWVDSRLQLLRFDGQSVVIECDRDITDRRADDEVRNLLMGELTHRVRNSLAIVQALARQTGRRATSVSKFLHDFGGRIEAMSSAHNLVSEAQWNGVDARALIESQTIARFGSDRAVSIRGDRVILGAQTAMHLVLILHELATNAEKFGALSDTCGRLDVSWEDVRGEPGKVEIEWRESGGPRVSAPKSKGFGLSLIERSKDLPYLVMNMEFEPTGLVCRMKIDADRGETRKRAYFSPHKS